MTVQILLPLARVGQPMTHKPLFEDCWRALHLLASAHPADTTCVLSAVAEASWAPSRASKALLLRSALTVLPRCESAEQATTLINAAGILAAKPAVDLPKDQKGVYAVSKTGTDEDAAIQLIPSPQVGSVWYQGSCGISGLACFIFVWSVVWNVTASDTPELCFLDVKPM